MILRSPQVQHIGVDVLVARLGRVILDDRLLFAPEHVLDRAHLFPGWETRLDIRVWRLHVDRHVIPPETVTHNAHQRQTTWAFEDKNAVVAVIL